MKKDDSVYLRHIMREVMREAARSLFDDLRGDCPHIPWRQMIGLRNRMIHPYFKANLQIIWEMVQGDIPNLKRETKRVLEDIGQERRHM